MTLYKPGEDVGPLEYWAFDNPASDYKILEGTPKAFGRIDSGGAGHTARFGIWQCTKGVFECTEQGDELMTILSGQCRIADRTNGDTISLTTGDSYYIKDSSRVTWHILEDVTKVFFGHKSGGY